MALTFATRYRAIPILVGITLATACVHSISVFVGAALGASIPTTQVTVLAGVAFVIFGM
jgi:putative Ca2+/H+ antiporter (TMEM165/GDT1 family)